MTPKDQNTTRDNTTEKRILDAAVEEFSQKGLFGARTQAIAEAAGVNKALLHYYFRSKEKLYQEVIETAMAGVQKKLVEAWFAEGDVETRLNGMADAFLDAILSSPGIVKIIMREVVDGGHRLRPVFEAGPGTGPDGEPVPAQAAAALSDALGVDPVEGFHIFINLVGMCVVSFTSPMLLGAMVKRIDTGDFNEYLEHRRAAIKAMLTAWVRSRTPEPR